MYDVLHTFLQPAAANIEPRRADPSREVHASDFHWRQQMFKSSLAGTFRAVTLVGLLVIPTLVAHANEGSTAPQPGSSPSAMQQALTRDPTAAPPRDVQTMNAADAYAKPAIRDEADAKARASTRLSNQPDWMGPEYTGQ
jgi:hypothetical protein